MEIVPESRVPPTIRSTGGTIGYAHRAQRGMAASCGDAPLAREGSTLAFLTITVGPFTYRARLEEAAAPHTCAAFMRLLPFQERIIQARWSGEAAWVPLGERQVGVGFENHTSHPAPGELLFYPGGFSETEILFPYGPTLFASKMG